VTGLSEFGGQASQRDHAQPGVGGVENFKVCGGGLKGRKEVMWLVSFHVCKPRLPALVEASLEVRFCAPERRNGFCRVENSKIWTVAVE
jgi:hypothetical protein